GTGTSRKKSAPPASHSLQPRAIRSMLECPPASLARPSNTGIGHPQLGGSMTHTAVARAPRAIRVLLFLTSLAWTSVANAQAGTIAGTITDPKRGLPLPDVSGTVDGATGRARPSARR